jgi:rRNA-processing protein FCF1
VVVFDTSTILYSIDPETKAPLDPATNALLTNCKERIEYLIKTLGAAKTDILIPTPVLAEFLVRAGPNRHEYVDKFIAARHFTIGVFDQRAAIELAFINDPDLNSGKKLDEVVTKAKLKFDRQVIAIAKTNGASCIYTGDDGLAGCARTNGIKAIMTWELPEPPKDPQLSLLGALEGGKA